MPIYYADTSVLVKRHVAETGSAWVQGLTDPASGNAIMTARVSMVEVYSAFNRRVYEGTLDATDYTTVVNDFAALCTTEYQLIEFAPLIVDHARGVLERRRPLRAYDAIQLASALAANDALLAQRLAPLIFLAADQRLLGAARAEGLMVDNPNTHP